MHEVVIVNRRTHFFQWLNTSDINTFAELLVYGGKSGTEPGRSQILRPTTDDDDDDA